MPEAYDPPSRLRALIDRMAPRLRRRFLALISRVRTDRSLSRIANLIEQNQIDEALRIVERAAASFAAEVGRVTIFAGTDTARFLAGEIGLVIDFDQVNAGAVQAMNIARLELVREFTAGQRDATREALQEGVRLGLNPRDQARNFRDSIGLTRTQQRAVNNYRRLLREGSGEALTRMLRDRRYDPTVRAAIAEARTLTRAQIDAMVSRYSQRYLRYRSEVIARTEAIRAVHQGAEEAYRQAIASGDLAASELTRQWNTKPDGRRRDSHAAMQGQRRPWGQPFLSGNGNLLRYPCDPMAPASDSIQCRCAVGTRIKFRMPETAGMRVLASAQ